MNNFSNSNFEAGVDEAGNIFSTRPAEEAPREDPACLGCSVGTGGGCHSLKNRGDFLSHNCSRMALHCSRNGSRIGPLQLAL